MRRRTAMTLITPITIPRAIFAAAAAAHRAPASRHGGSRVGRHRVLKHGGAGERPDERADHGSNYGHGNTHHRADQSADQRAPSRALQGAVSPREPEPQPRLDQLAQKCERENERSGPEAHGLEVGEPAVA